ncbi:hypothetical protein SNEBB_009574 [Seison nebaliae]|nr:hypothetical protein SNEBB_009574 [Seison nebaliae]
MDKKEKSRTTKMDEKTLKKAKEEMYVENDRINRIKSLFCEENERSTRKKNFDYLISQNIFKNSILPKITKRLNIYKNKYSLVNHQTKKSDLRIEANRLMELQTSTNTNNNNNNNNSEKWNRSEEDSIDDKSSISSEHRTDYLEKQSHKLVETSIDSSLL